MVRFDRLRLGAAAALLLALCGSAQAGWRHYSDGYPEPPAPAWDVTLFPQAVPPVIYGWSGTPYAVPTVPGAYRGWRSWGLVRYNRPCLLERYGHPYAVTCSALTSYGLIDGFNGR